MRAIQAWINRIERTKKFSYTTLEDEDRWTFFGDGQGDFELICENVESPEIVQGYINECKRQIALAEELLETMDAHNVFRT